MRSNPGKRLKLRWYIVIATVLFIIMFLATKAEAHTEEELDTWLQEWSIEANAGITDVLILQFIDMRGRHGWYWGAPIIMPHSFNKNRGMGTNVNQWELLVSQYFDPSLVQTALCVIRYESGGNPDALNSEGSTAAGLFQFLKGTWDSMPITITGGTYGDGKVYEPEANVRAAAWLQADAGWAQWNAYRMCH